MQISVWARRLIFAVVGGPLAGCVAIGGFVAAVAQARPAVAQVGAGELIPQTVALRHGLHRRWVSQASMDLARDRLAFVTLSRDVLCVQTKNGLAQVLNAETGGSRWTAQVGRVGDPCSELAANDLYVAMTSGTILYVLEIDTGKPVWQRQLEGPPWGAPALDASRVYVPKFNGAMVSYSLTEPKNAPWMYQSGGRILAQPTLTPESVAWGTMNGVVYSSDLDHVRIRFRLETGGPIVAPIAARDGMIYVASRDGYAYALDEKNGHMHWRFSTGIPLAHQPVVVHDTVYLFPEAGGMFAVAANNGAERWRRNNVQQFLALRRADPKHPELGSCLYVADRTGKTLMLDPATGGLIDTLPTESLTMKMTNTLNDRLYLATPTGMIQCFHHPELVEPLWHPATDEAAADARPPRRADGDSEPAEEMDEPAEFDPFDEPADDE